MKQSSAFEPRSRARRRALQALYQWQITGQEAAEILRQFRAVQDMKGVDEAYFEALLRGIVAGQEGLDDELQPFLDRPIGQVDLMERVVLRIGAFELLNCPELPFRVVLDECVDLAHRFGSEQGHSYVNAVLDRAARQWRSAEAERMEAP
jgi:N utilization substance protein B